MATTNTGRVRVLINTAQKKCKITIRNIKLNKMLDTHPIIMSSPMVQGILEDRKGMTRRVVKGRALEWLSPDMFTPEYVALPENNMCPYGKPGDILWVRETWQQECKKEMPSGEDWYSKSFVATGNYVYKTDNISLPKESFAFGKWRPSIHMPKAACRIFLKITGVRVERLQEISEADAIKEGVGAGFQMNAGWPDYTRIKNGICELTQDTAKVSFWTLWESINGKGSWESNPWVWVITFERTGKPEKF